MNVKILLVTATAMWMFFSAVYAQGFANLGATADGFALPDPEIHLRFPDDHGAHPQFKIEWWYLTANLKGDDGQDYGAQWTLFRSAIRPGDDGTVNSWSSPQLWMGHAAITSRDQHFVSERRARGGTGQAGVTASPFRAWIDNWQLLLSTKDGESLYGPTLEPALSALTVEASEPVFSFHLQLRTDKQLVLHGDRGYSVKAESGHASHYYSQPFYKITGSIKMLDELINVTGNAWLDREWSSQPLAGNQKGWDWISLHFDNGSKLMGFGVRNDTGSHFTSATFIDTKGHVYPYGDGALVLEPLEFSTVEGRNIPTRWKVELADRNLSYEIVALNNNAWMNTSFPYWEGPVRISGSQSGVGYLEMTGYK